MNAPKSISKPNPYTIKFLWRDGIATTIKLESFRKECPCAVCKGETIAGKVVAFPSMQMFTPGMNELKELTQVGNYAVTATWGDGHDTGIYNWDYLRAISDQYSLTDEQVEKIAEAAEQKKKSSMN